MSCVIEFPEFKSCLTKQAAVVARPDIPGLESTCDPVVLTHTRSRSSSSVV